MSTLPSTNNATLSLNSDTIYIYNNFLNSISTSSTLLFAQSGNSGMLSFSSQSPNLVFAGPSSGGSSVPTFRALVSTDLPLISLTSGISGILSISNGGTGTSSTFSSGSIVFANASGIYSQNNSDLFWDNTNFQLGINTNTPGANIDLRALTSSTVLNIGGTCTNSSASVFSVNNAVTFNSLISTSVYGGVMSQPTYSPSSNGTTTNYYGEYINPISSGSSTLTISNVYGAYIQLSNSNTTSTWSNAYDLYISPVVNTGVITNHWSLYNASASSSYFAKNVGLNQTVPTSTLHLSMNSSNLIQFAIDGTYTTNSSFVVVGIYVAYTITSTGNGAVFGCDIAPNLSPTSGTTGSFYGTSLAPTLGGSSTNTVSSMYGLNIQLNNNNTNCTVTNAYDLYINPITNVGVITNHWSLYNASTASSYFAGNVGFGKNNPAYLIDINFTSGLTPLNISGTYSTTTASIIGENHIFTVTANNCTSIYGYSCSPTLSPTSGTTNNFVGIQIGMNTGGSSTNTITHLYGINISNINGNSNCTITNAYDLFISTLISAGPITNHWSIYNASTYSSYFASNIGINNNAPAANLDIKASTYLSIINISGTSTAAVGPVYGINNNPTFTGAVTTSVFGINNLFTFSPTVTGSISNLYGMYVNPIAGGTAVRTTSNIYGIAITLSNSNTNSTWTNAYDLFINSKTNSGVITNRWSLYNASSDSSYFASSIGINTSSATAQLDIRASSPSIVLNIAGTCTSSSALLIGTNNQTTFTSLVSSIYGFINSPIYSPSTGGATTSYYGMYLNPSSGGSSTGSITNTYGLYIQLTNSNVNNTWTNAYDLYISSKTNTGTISNRWSLYNNSTDNSYFAANVGIGANVPTANLDVRGSTQSAILSIAGTSTSTTSALYGIYNHPTFTGLVASGTVYGINSSLTYSPSTNGTTTNFYGQYINPILGGGSTSVCTNVYGLNIQLANTNATSTWTNAYDLYINSKANSGVITNKWSFYNNSTDNSYFAGNVGFNNSSPSYPIDCAGNIAVTSVGSGFRVKEGSGAKMGIATLSGSTVVVSNTSVTANSRIFLTCQSPSGGIGSLYISSRSAGVSFTVNSTGLLDNSTFAYQIFEPA